MYCNFMHPEFKELQGLIPIHTLNQILNQLKQSDSIVVNPVACSCVIRCTHNLACVHEIAMFQRDGWPILLECIDHQWGKLDMLPVPEIMEEGIGYQKIWKYSSTCLKRWKMKEMCDYLKNEGNIKSCQFFPF